MIIRILAKFNFILFHKIRQHRQNNSYNIYYTIMESIMEEEEEEALLSDYLPSYGEYNREIKYICKSY